MNADKEPSKDDKFVNAFVIFASYVILSFCLILLANEIWFWGKAEAREVENAMRSAICVVAVRVGLFSIWRMLSPAKWENVKAETASISALSLTGFLVLSLLHLALGATISPAVGVLLLDTVLHAPALLLMGIVFRRKRA